MRGAGAHVPRLDWQPICYPVLKGNCTSAFARDGNPKDVANGSVGYVTAWAQARLDWND